jgi:adenine phosphoribosyltransferase
VYDFDADIRKVPDFPKPGILFYDITSVLGCPEAFDAVQVELDNWIGPGDYDGILGVESRGFVFAAVAAHRHKKPLYLARKPGKLPNATKSQSYELEYGSSALEIQDLDLQKGGRWLVVDDLIATGGTLEATCQLLNKGGVDIAGVFALIGLPFLGYEQKLKAWKPHTLVQYHSE